MIRARVALATLLLAALAGCTPATTVAEPSASSSPSDTPSASPTPEPSPSTPALPCADLLDAATTQRFADFAADGWQAIPDFAERIGAQDTPLAEFVRSGGTVCQWGYPASDISAVLAWAPLTPSTSSELQTDVLASGYAAEPSEEGVMLCNAPGEDESITAHCYLFTDDAAFYADPRESLPMIVSQVAAR